MNAPTPDEIAQLRSDEGFRGQPYNDTLGFATIGYGTRLPLTPEEAEWLMMRRWDIMRMQLRAAYRQETGESLDHLPTNAVRALDNMVYQLGPSKVMAFKKMVAALVKRDFAEAAAQMKDSRWHDQTPNRCERAAALMRGYT